MWEERLPEQNSRGGDAAAGLVDIPQWKSELRDFFAGIRRELRTAAQSSETGGSNDRDRVNETKVERAPVHRPVEVPPRHAGTASQTHPPAESDGRGDPDGRPGGEDRLANLKRQLAARLGERDEE